MILAQLRRFCNGQKASEVGQFAVAALGACPALAGSAGIY
jgi:hypothetical protein